MLVHKLICTHCATTLSLKSQSALTPGKMVKCPKCAKEFPVPAEPTVVKKSDTRPLDLGPVRDELKKRSGIKPAGGSKQGDTIRPTGGSKHGDAVKPTSGSKQGVPQGDTRPLQKPDQAAIQEKLAAKPAEPKLIARFTCPACKATLKPANPVPAGKKIKCPKCARPIDVPAEEAPAPAIKPADPKKDDPGFDVVDDDAEPQLVSETNCPGCKAKLRPAKPWTAGKVVKCPKCALMFTVKAVEEEDVVEAEVVDDEEDEEPPKPVAKGKKEAEPAAELFRFDVDEPVAGKKDAPVVKTKAGKKDKKAKKAKQAAVSDEEAAASRAKMLWTIGGSVGGLAVLAVLVFVVAPLVMDLLKSSAQWKDYSPAGGRFRVQLPGAPDEQAVPGGKDSPGGKRFTLDRPKQNDRFLVYYIDLDNIATGKMSFDDLCLEEQRNLLPRAQARVEGKLTEMPDRGDIKGREVRHELNDGSSVVMRFYLQEAQPNDRLFVVMAKGKDIAPGKGDAAKFFDSFVMHSPGSGPGTDPIVRPTGKAPVTPDPKLDEKERAIVDILRSLKGEVFVERLGEGLFIGLRGKEIRDAHLSNLAELPGLLKLEIVTADITDDGLKHVAKLGSLSELKLRHVAISDAGLAHLKDMRGLKKLMLEGTQITQKGIDVLHKTNKDLEVYK